MNIAADIFLPCVPPGLLCNSFLGFAFNYFEDERDDDDAIQALVFFDSSLLIHGTG